MKTAQLVKVVASTAIVITVLGVFWLLAISGSIPIMRDYEWRVGREFDQANMINSSTLYVSGFGTCNGNPITEVEESGSVVRVNVISSTYPFRGGADDCDDGVEVGLATSFGNRVLIDLQSGNEIEVSGR